MRKNSGIIIAGFIIVLIGLFLFFVQGQGMFMTSPGSPMNQSDNNQSDNQPISTDESSLPIPSLLKDENPDPNKAEFQLTAQNSKKEFVSGKITETMGYNGDYLGPVIRVRKGEEVSVKVENNLDDEITTIHWHGLEVDGDQDGGHIPGFNQEKHGHRNLRSNNQQPLYGFTLNLSNKQGDRYTKDWRGCFL